MNSKKRPPTDARRPRRHRLRRHHLRRQNERRLLWVVLFLLVVVGGGLIGLFIGPVEMLAALPCLLSGAVAILGLYLALAIVERWVSRW